MDFTFEANRPSETLGTFHVIKGDLKVMEGQWSFQDSPDGIGIIASHELRVRPRFPSPRWLVRRTLRKDLPGMMACIRGLAEASGDATRVKKDLRRCPGDISLANK